MKYLWGAISLGVVAYLVAAVVAHTQRGEAYISQFPYNPTTQVYGGPTPSGANPYPIPVQRTDTNCDNTVNVNDLSAVAGVINNTSKKWRYVSGTTTPYVKPCTWGVLYNVNNNPTVSGYECSIDSFVNDIHTCTTVELRSDVNSDKNMNVTDLSIMAGTSGSFLRNKFKQPFAVNSIWNMPIGSNATLEDVPFDNWFDNVNWGVFIEENYIFNDVNAGPADVYWSDDMWECDAVSCPEDRCDSEEGENDDTGTPVAGGGYTGAEDPDGLVSQQIDDANLPSNYFIGPAGFQDTPNNAAAIITDDGEYYIQTQPISHCDDGNDDWTTGYVQDPVSLYGDGIAGAQGGSHMSAVGGTIRLGELDAANQATPVAIPHALKLVVDDLNLYDGGGGTCYMWPALSCDSDHSGYDGTDPDLMMGTLLAIDSSYNCASEMDTVPGEIICLTLQKYGAYIVDTGWGPTYLAVEYSPSGDVPTEFDNEFGFDMKESSESSAWSIDIRDLMVAAKAVTNNTSSSIGGGGTPVVPLANEIGN